MKRHGDLWSRVVAWDNLLLAARKARRGKRGRPVVARWEFQREWHQLALQQELMTGTWRPGPYTTHTIARPKRRLISAAWGRIEAIDRTHASDAAGVRRSGSELEVGTRRGGRYNGCKCFRWRENDQ